MVLTARGWQKLCVWKMTGMVKQHRSAISHIRMNRLTLARDKKFLRCRAGHGAALNPTCSVHATFSSLSSPKKKQEKVEAHQSNPSFCAERAFMCIPQLFSCFICTYTTHEQVGRVLHIEMHLQSENKYIPMHVHSSSQPYYPEKKRTDCISLKINSKSHFARQANVSLVRCSSWHCPSCDHRRECSQMH